MGKGEFLSQAGAGSLADDARVDSVALVGRMANLASGADDFGFYRPTMAETNLDELKGLVAEIRADHQAQKAKEKRDAWTKFVSLSMIFLAVLAAFATQKGGGFSSAVVKQLNEATFNQTKAADEWAFFQAKGIKLSLYEIERDHLAAQTEADPKALAAVTAKVAKYEGEKKEIQEKAREFEAKRDASRADALANSQRGQKMGLAITFFQAAIAIGGMCMVMKKRWLWAVSLLCGVVATAQMIITLRAG